MKELILTWNSGAATRTIRFDQTGIPSPRFRIGRDPATCDLVLPSATQDDLTVSKLHVEIYFDPASDRFYLKNLKGAQNPPKLYGQTVLDAPVAIDKTGILQLGRRELTLALVAPPPALPVTVAPPEYRQPAPPPDHRHPTPASPPEHRRPAPPPEPTKPLVCPHCATGYTYEEAAKLNGRCPKDGFLLHGASIYVPPNA